MKQTWLFMSTSLFAYLGVVEVMVRNGTKIFTCQENEILYDYFTCCFFLKKVISQETNSGGFCNYFSSSTIIS